MSEDLIVKVEVIDNKWYIRETESYSVTKSQGAISEPLVDGDILAVTSSKNVKVSILVRETNKSFGSAYKYDISKITTITIGEDDNNDISYQYASYVSRKHAVIEKKPSGYMVKDISSNGTFVNGRRIKDENILQYGDCINIFGLKIVFLGSILAILAFANGSCKVSELLPRYLPQDSKVEKRCIVDNLKQFFNRAPRAYMQIKAENIDIDPPPAPKEMDKKPLWMVVGPSFTMIIPMMAGSILMIYSSKMSGNTTSLYMYTGVITAFGAATVGVFWAINNIRYNKKVLDEAEKQRYKAYGDYLVNRANFIKSKYEDCRNILSAMYPDVIAVSSYTNTSEALWNRNTSHADFLDQRLGTGSIDFPMNINVPKERFSLISDKLADKPQSIKKDYSILYDVPINVDLVTYKLIGIIGGIDKVGAYSLVRTLSTQIAANNCYTDVKLIYIFDKNEDYGNWEYAKWFPHTWSEDKRTRYIASNKTEASDIFFELMQIFRMRAENEKQSENKIYKPYYILFVSDISLLEGELITKYMYDNSRAYGLTSVILAESREQLPNMCSYVLQNDKYFCGVHDLSENVTRKIKFDKISNQKVEEFSRRLSSIEVKEVEIGKDIPESVTFFEMYNALRLEDFEIESKWRKNRNYENMKALIGVKGGGLPCYLDVHEKYHGPHGLIAGTTGSGKSETLQTYLLSLAVNFSPDDVGFFIIDYKGGGMAGLFEGLPHMMGSISNLSGNQVRRAMVSIKSESKKRQRLFNENNVNNINLYTKLYKNGMVSEPIPHLFVVIDEFAELKREEPEFMKELISVAQVGRSLGVHLILATQKPSGTVDDNIWSNAKFRLCLRVQDQQDSKDMLHKSDAAFITQAGRGYLQVGNDEVYELFQSGYSGAQYIKENEISKNEIVVMVSETGRDTYISASKKKIPRDFEKIVTQLDAVIEYLARVADENKYRRQAQLWMPLLPTIIHLNEFDEFSKNCFSENKWAEAGNVYSLSTVIGLCDDPVNQAQMPLIINFAGKGHLAVCGSITSGKSNFLKSLMYGLISIYSPEKLNVYAIDFSSQMLTCFERAPHVGGVMIEDDEEKISKFFYMMDTLLDERKRMLRGGNYAQYVQANGYTIPSILIVVDNYGTFREKTNNKYDEQMLHIAKEGVNIGIYLALSATGFSASEIPSKIGDTIKNVVCLNMNDKNSYMDAIRINHLEILPENSIKGRGMCLYNDTPLEFQTALSVTAVDDFSRGEKIKKVCELMEKCWDGKKANLIPTIPEKPMWSEFEKLDLVKSMMKDTDYLPLGYDMVSAKIYGVDLSKTYSYLISGRARTGKKTVLKSFIISASKKNGRVAVIEHGTTDLESVARRHNATYINSIQEQSEFFAEMVDVFRKRTIKKKEMVSLGCDETEIYSSMSKEKPYFIIVKDITSFIKSVYSNEAGVKSIDKFIENISERGRLHNIYFFFGINQDTVSEVMIKKAYMGFISFHTGIQLGGNITTAKYFDGSNFDFKEQNGSVKLGVGMIPAGNNDNVKWVILPLVKG